MQRIGRCVVPSFGRNLEPSRLRSRRRDPRFPGCSKYTRVFEDAVRLMADCMDVNLEEVRFEYELAACTKDVDLGWYRLPKGSLGGCYLKYIGIVDGGPEIESTSSGR